MTRTQYRNISIFKSFIVFVFAMFFSAFQASAVILEKQSLQEIAPLIDKDTLLVFDIDNTLITQNQSMGTGEWYTSLYASFLANGLSESEARLKAQKAWDEINALTQVTLVEKDTAKFIRKLQNQGVQVMALTARFGYFPEVTDKQLRGKNIDLRKTAIESKSDIMIDQKFRYKNGVLFANENDKGLVLQAFLKHFKMTPKKIVFVDDISKNTQAVENAFSTMPQIQNFNIRYGALDAQVKNFNSKIATVEWNEFNKTRRIISDVEAQKIFNNQCELC